MGGCWGFIELENLPKWIEVIKSSLWTLWAKYKNEGLSETERDFQVRLTYCEEYLRVNYLKHEKLLKICVNIHRYKIGL